MNRNKKIKFAFTLVELLVVISIIAMLLAILMPSLTKARHQAKTVICRSNLSQIHLGFEMYLQDFNRDIFPLVYIDKDKDSNYGKFWYFGFEPATSFSKPEGQRQLDRTYAKLFPYIQQYDSVEICPAFPYNSGLYKPKYETRWMTYGINSSISLNLTLPGRKIVNFERVFKSPNNKLLFADTAMVNYWQAPASPSNPMFEEWHYIETSGEPSVHFRHGEKANILFADGHIDDSAAKTGSYNEKLPNLKIGNLPESSDRYSR